MTTDTNERDDLFTHIHKALRLALFDITAQAGRTDWADNAEVEALGDQWRPLLALLQAHTGHEDNHILRLLDPYEPATTEPTSEQHRDLDDLLDDLAHRFEAALADPHPSVGLDLYRDLARFVAAYLPHLHDEETRVMARIWDLCRDDEIAATRVAFMADTTPDVTTTSLRYLLPALDRPTRRALIARLAAAAPPPVVEMALGIAERVLDDATFADLHAAATAPGKA
ncbi:MAG: hemerythrin domain-containing protein [Actinomycetota bacterium]|nr:hemerythrin domain-containing protein [Actinomycetota bacterium]